MLEILADPANWVALITLIAIEIVLGIDNIIFISIAVDDLPESQRRTARIIGLGLALLGRIVFLLTIAWIIGLTAPLFTIFGEEISWRDMILIAGGFFLLAKSTLEIHENIEGEGHAKGVVSKAASFAGVIVQILILDLVFSFDSVITAIGMVEHVQIMIIAVVFAILFMLFFSEYVSKFVERFPTMKMLALSFLVMIGVALIADGVGVHIPKGFIYFAMAFSLMVEVLNIQVRKARASEQ